MPFCCCLVSSATTLRQGYLLLLLEEALARADWAIPNDNSNRAFGTPVVFDRLGAFFDRFAAVVDRFSAVFDRLGAVFDRLGVPIENGAETKHSNSTRTARPPKGPGSSSRI